MSTVIKNLEEFIETAKHNRKYPYGTAVGRKAALKLFEPELNAEERESLDTLKSNVEKIYQSLYNKNKSKMTAESWVTYKNRFISLISDYEKYGLEPSKMANWNRPIRKIALKDEKIKTNTESQVGSPFTEKYKDVDMSRFELPLRPGVKAIILVPSDLTKEEVGKVRKYVDFLDSIAGSNIDENKTK